MQLKTKENLKEYPILNKTISKITLRGTVQVLIAVMMLFAAWQFYNFVHYLRYAYTGPVPERPPVAEGFLPVAAFLALKVYLFNGEFDTFHPAGLTIILATLVTAWIFRRALCSWLCPIGTLVEYLGKLGRKITGGRTIHVNKWLDLGLLALKYILFISFFKMFLFMSPIEAMQFMKIPYYAISDIKMFDFFLNISAKGIAIILVLMVLSTFIKSFWCRYLCPYGALLGILGFFSPNILVKDSETCINCNKCNKVCPNNVDVQGKKKYVLSTECTGCTSCVTACPKKGTLQFKLLGFIPLNALTYSIAFLAVFFGFVIWAKFTGHWETVMSFNDYQMIDKVMSGAFGSVPGGGAGMPGAGGGVPGGF